MLNCEKQGNGRALLLCTFLLDLFLSLSGLVVTLFLLADPWLPEAYHALCFLPMSFGVISFIFYRVYECFFKLYTVSIIIALYYLRMVVIPLFLFLSDYSKISPVALTAGLYSRTVALMIYEFFIVMAVVCWKVRRVTDFSGTDWDAESGALRTSSPFVDIVILLMAAAVLVLFIRYPLLRDYLAPITSLMDNGQNYQHFLLRRQLIPGVVLWPYSLAVDILRQVVPLVLIYLVYRCASKHKRRGFAVFLSMSIVVVSCCFVTDMKALSFLIAAAQFIIVYHMYRRQVSKIAPWFVLLFFVAVTASFYYKTHLDSAENFNKAVSDVLQNYFSGPEGVAVALSVDQLASPAVWISDLGNSIPLFGHFFTGLPTSRDLFNKLFYQNEFIKSNFLIIPMVGQSSYYFTPLFAPVFSALSSFFAVRFNLTIGKKKNMFHQYATVFLSIVFAVSPVMYNLSIVYNYFFITVFSMYSFSALSFLKRTAVSNKRNNNLKKSKYILDKI